MFIALIVVMATRGYTCVRLAKLQALVNVVLLPYTKPKYNRRKSSLLKLGSLFSEQSGFGDIVASCRNPSNSVVRITRAHNYRRGSVTCGKFQQWSHP